MTQRVGAQLVCLTNIGKHSCHSAACPSLTAKPRDLKESLCFLCLLLTLHSMSIFPATGFPSHVQALASEMSRMPQLTSPAAKFPPVFLSWGSRAGTAGAAERWSWQQWGVWERACSQERGVGHAAHENTSHCHRPQRTTALPDLPPASLGRILCAPKRRV